jgi:hypothetical protein
MPLDFLHKNQRGQGNSSLGEVNPPDPTIIGGLLGASLTITGTHISILVKVSGVLVAQVIISEIISWSIDALSITVITLDANPLVLSFISQTERNIGITVIETAMNY